MKSYKFSKTYIFAFMYRFAFLLFVPFLQGLLFAYQGALRLFTLYSADLAVAVFLLSIAVIRCQKGRVTVNGSLVEIHQGAVFKTNEKSAVSFKGSVCFTEGLLLRLLGGSRMRVFAGTGYCTAYLKRNDAKELLKSLVKDEEKSGFSSGIFRSLLMSLSFSNALTGLLAAVPIIRRASAVLGARQTALLLEGASLEGLLKFTGLPPVLSRVSSLLFFCWVVGSSTEFFREYGLKFQVFPSYFKVSKGLMTKTQAIFTENSVKALVFRQSLLLFLSGFYSAEVNLNIRPRRKIHILSAAGASRCADLEDVLLGEKGKHIFRLTPPKTALFSYTWLPLLCLCLSSIILILFSQNIIVKTISGVVSGIFAVWFLFRTVALFRSSLTVWEKFAEVRYFSGMNFTRYVFRLSDITSGEITQSIFQRINGRCSLIIRIGNTKALKVKIKHLRLQDIKKLKQT